MVDLSDYWRVSKTPIQSILFVTPLWGLYEYLTFQLNHSWYGSLRTGLDYLIKSNLQSIRLPGWFFMVLLVLIALIYCYKKKAFSVSKSGSPILPACCWKLSFMRRY